MEQQNNNKLLQYILPCLGICILATLVALFAFPDSINIIISIFIGLLLVLFIYNIVLVSGKNITREGNKLILRDVFFKTYSFDIGSIQKIEVHTNFVCRIYDIKIIKIQENGTDHKFYVAKIKPEELNKIVSSSN